MLTRKSCLDVLVAWFIELIAKRFKLLANFHNCRHGKHALWCHIWRDTSTFSESSFLLHISHQWLLDTLVCWRPGPEFWCSPDSEIPLHKFFIIFRTHDVTQILAILIYTYAQLSHMGSFHLRESMEASHELYWYVKSIFPFAQPWWTFSQWIPCWNTVPTTDGLVYLQCF